MNMPRHIADKLIADGVMTERYVTHKTRPRRCPRCGAQTLAAISDLLMETYVDPDPLTPLGELLAAVTGRATYAVFGTDLCHRDPNEIAYRSADKLPVFAIHKCREKPLPHQPQKKPAAAADAPPF